MSACAASLVMLQVTTRARGVPRASQLRRWMRAALHGAAVITVRVVGAREARTLNRDYRGADHATNVLAFDMGRIERVLHGDLVLCAPVIAREAREQRKTPEAHYAHLTVHGVLHLRGYGHASRAAAQRMERAERAVLRKLGYSDPY
jgi:probable rRNA maturation factor